MPRPMLYPVKKIIGFRKETLAAVDKWRRKQADLPNQTEAIRRLVAAGLNAAKGRG